MSGKEMLQYGCVDEININGTCHVLDACLDHGVKRLVYVSTYNVVFGGKEIVNGNEALAYFPIDDHVDPYGRSKSIAEQLVLKSNGRPFKNKKGKLYSCAIRPAAIYGPGEERHLPRIVKLAKLGLLPFKIGATNVKSDWVYVDNLVTALLLASMGLLDDIPGIEGQPVVQSTVLSSSGHYSMVWTMTCKLSLEVRQALLLGKLFRVFYSFLYPLLSREWLPQPLILPAEVYKVGVTHYFSILKAKEELGYRPMVSPQEGMATTIAYWKERKRRTLDGPTIYAWIFVIVGMTILFCGAYMPDIGPISVFRTIILFFLRSIPTARGVFLVSMAAHIGEAVYAWKLARKFDPANARGWFWQTFALGIFSLRYLLKRAKK
ncbi:hypothetical protein DH2020_035655 [Rehmannia glutinosa]|uniref:3-beta hydroxysteroid dehydrogenase/isomerase domain-containing protein n=1 Tax=Rehmannia glutinosa TaxID=99300 RepID=A0ABR0V8P1_REHGL